VLGWFAGASRRRGALIGLVLASALIAVSTLTPAGAASGDVSTPPLCLLCGDAVASDVLLNIALFLPFGLALAASGVRWRPAVAIVIVTTVTIEALQLHIVSGRDASLRDVVSNTIGGSLGWWLGGRVRSLAFPTPREARTLAALWLTMLGMLSCLGAWSTAPSFTPMPWFSQFALFSPQGFKGQVMAAAIGDARLPVDSLADSASHHIAREITRGEGATAMVITASPSNDAVHLLQLADRQSAMLLAFYQEHADALFFVRLRASDLGFRSPRFRLRDAFPLRPGVLAHATGWHARDMVRVDVTGGGRERRVTYRVSAHWGWAMLAPSISAIDQWEPYFTATWIALLVIPLGYWCAAGARGPAGRWFAIPMFSLTALVMLVVAPTTFGLSPGGVNEWLGLLVGGLLGGAVWRSAMSLASPACDQRSDRAVA
jgi:hypothetical protein